MVIPVFNEERVIENSIKRVYERLKELGYSFEIIIADDGSTDSTTAIVRDLQKKYKNIKFFRKEKNMGRGEILSSAFKTAKGKYIGFTDIDLAINIKHFRELIENLKDGDVATGSRWLPESKVKRGLVRWAISYFYNAFIRLIFKSKIHDHQCGFKSFKRDVALKLISECEIKKNRRWAWDTEILIRAQKHKFKIIEFPVEWSAGTESRFKLLRDLWIVGTYLIKLYFDIGKIQND